MYAALALDRPRDSLLVCNGFKDEAFINLALIGAHCGQRVVIVVEKLNELDTSNVEPLAQVAPPAAAGQGAAVGTPLRQDETAPCDIIGDVLAGAPDASPPYFRVPRVIER